MPPAQTPSEDDKGRLIEEVLSFQMPLWVRLVQQRIEAEKGAARDDDAARRSREDRQPSRSQSQNYLTSYLNGGEGEFTHFPYL